LRAAYFFHDLNHALDFSASTTRDEQLGYENVKVVNLQRPWTYYRKMNRNLITDPTSTIVDTISIKGYYATTDPTRTQAIGFWFDQIYGTITGDKIMLGTLITTYYISTYGRR